MHEYREKIIIDHARQAIKDIALPFEKNISELTKYSRAIIRKWQAFCAEDPKIGNAIELTIWHPQSRAFGFSVYDAVSKTAYELKVTCKNPRNQFYKAICKALLKNSPDKEQKEVNNNEEKDNVVDKLILIVSPEGEKNLYGTENGQPGNSLPSQMIDRVKFGFDVKIVKIK